MRLMVIAEDAVPKNHDVLARLSDFELDQQARAETEAGVGVPIEEVEAWVESWDTPNETPMPKARKIR
jgi:predicted transcriptional regulator